MSISTRVTAGSWPGLRPGWLSDSSSMSRYFEVSMAMGSSQQLDKCAVIDVHQRWFLRVPTGVSTQLVLSKSCRAVPWGDLPNRSKDKSAYIQITLDVALHRITVQTLSHFLDPLQLHSPKSHVPLHCWKKYNSAHLRKMTTSVELANCRTSTHWCNSAPQAPGSGAVLRHPITSTSTHCNLWDEALTAVRC